MRILHIFNNEKFVNQYIEFIDRDFDDKNHFFIIIGNNNYMINSNKNIVNLNKNLKSIILLIGKINTSDKIIVHGLSNPRIVEILFALPWVLKKCYWTIWGSDLYQYIYRKDTMNNFLFEILRRKVIKNMGGLITHIKGDFELAQKWYGAQGVYYYSFMYPSNLYKEYDLKSELNKNTFIIQIGNSADPSNNHIEILEKLERYKDENIEIVCPLSYGDKEYRNKVICRGENIFGEKFNALNNFLPYNEYLNSLAKVDVAIFNHKRQQGMGNITTLLGLGKKVYVRDDITTWKFFIQKNLKVYKSNGNFDDLFENMESKIIKRNIQIIKKNFSQEKLKKDWSIIFDSNIN